MNVYKMDDNEDVNYEYTKDAALNGRHGSDMVGFILYWLCTKYSKAHCCCRISAFVTRCIFLMMNKKEKDLYFHECLIKSLPCKLYVDFDFKYETAGDNEQKGIFAVKELCSAIEDTYRRLYPKQATRSGKMEWFLEHGPNKKKFSMHIKTASMCFSCPLQLHLFMITVINDILSGNSSLDITQKRLIRKIDFNVYTSGPKNSSGHNLRMLWSRKAKDGAKRLVKIKNEDFFKSSQLVEDEPKNADEARKMMEISFVTNILGSDGRALSVLRDVEREVEHVEDSKTYKTAVRLLEGHSLGTVVSNVTGKNQQQKRNGASTRIKSSWARKGNATIRYRIIPNQVLNGLNAALRLFLSRPFTMTYFEEYKKSDGQSGKRPRAHLVPKKKVRKDLTFPARCDVGFATKSSNDIVFISFALNGVYCPFDTKNQTHHSTGRKLTYAPRRKQGKFSLLCYFSTHVLKKAYFDCRPLQNIIDHSLL